VAHDANATGFSTAKYSAQVPQFYHQLTLRKCAPVFQRNSEVQTAHGRFSSLSWGRLALIILQSPVAFSHWCTLPMEKPLCSNATFHGYLGKSVLQVINHKMESYMQLLCLTRLTTVYRPLTYLVVTWLPISLYQAIIAGREPIRRCAGQTK
jgi:hypothetical protein